jgi:predicted nucleic acid-binding protein
MAVMGRYLTGGRPFGHTAEKAMENSTDVLFDSTIIVGAHVAEGEEREACRAALALAEQRRIRAHICGNALGQIAEDLARSAGKEAAKEWITEARQYLNVVATNSAILEAALSYSLSADGVYLDDAITIHTARLLDMGLIVTLNGDDYSAATTPVAPPQQLLEQVYQQAGAA